MASLNLLEPIVETEKHLFCVEIMNRLNIQRENEQFCDVILEVGSGNDLARLKAHKIMLCAGSPFFNNALNSEMKEKKEGVIRLEQTSKEVMEEVLKYLYTGHVDVSEALACDFLAVADYLMIQCLKDLCAQVILRGMCLSNCVAAYYLSVKYHCEELKKGARVFILENFVNVAKTEDFLNLSKEQFLEWISSDEINVSGEEEVFEIMKNWITTNKSQEQSFYELFRHIRFMYLPHDFFLEVIVPDPIVKNNLDCSNFALEALKMMIRGELEGFFAQPPRDCLKTHEDVIVACGKRGTSCYVPSTMQWYRLTDVGCQQDFYSKNVSYCKGKLFIIGGTTGHSPAEFYDPSLNRWFSLKSFKKMIKFCTVSSLQGFLYVIGGVDEEGNFLSSVQRYNPDKDFWQEMPSLCCPRSSVCAVSDGSFMYAIGGNTEIRPVDVVERFDPKEKKWERIPSTLEKRMGAGGAAVNGSVFVFGGVCMGTKSASVFAEMYDPAINEWSSILTTAFVASKLRRVSVVNFKETIYVFSEGKLHIYDTVTREWVYFGRCPRVTSFSRLTCLRVPREILNLCEVISAET